MFSAAPGLELHVSDVGLGRALLADDLFTYCSSGTSAPRHAKAGYLSSLFTRTALQAVLDHGDDRPYFVYICYTLQLMGSAPDNLPCHTPDPKHKRPVDCSPCDGTH